MKSVLLLMEAVVLAGPLTLFVAFTSIIFLMGLIDLTLDHSGPHFTFVGAIIAWAFGVFALVKLWSLSLQTAKGYRFSFDRSFWLALVVSVGCFIELMTIVGRLSVLIALPAYLLTAHMSLLQWRRNDAQPGVPADGPRPTGSARG
jgi:hypothetical protein